MAFRRYRRARRYRRYGARSFGGRRYFNRRKSGLFGGKTFGIRNGFLIGVAGALLMPSNKMVSTAAVAAAVAPFRLGAAKTIAQGYVMGELIEAVTGFTLGDKINLFPNGANGTISGNIV